MNAHVETDKPTFQKFVLKETREIAWERIRLGRNSRLNYVGIPELSAGIESSGLIEPLIVSAILDGEGKETGDFEIKAGYRRHRAIDMIKARAKKAKKPDPFETVRCQIFVGTELEGVLINLQENHGRENLTTYELGVSFRVLRDEFKMNGREIAETVGYHKSHVNNCISVVENLCPEIKSFLEAGHQIPNSYLFDWKSLPPEEQLKEFNKWRNHNQPKDKETSESKGRQPREERPEAGQRMVSARKAQAFFQELKRQAKETENPELQFGIRVAAYLMGKTERPPIKLEKPTERRRRKLPKED